MTNNADSLDTASKHVEAALRLTIERLGGQNAVKEMQTAQTLEMKERWNKDVLTIGRILRSHLYVEHYLNEFLEYKNPCLGSISRARLTFSQKLELLPRDNRSINEIIHGIRHLNHIRNRLAHQLEATITEADSEIFLQGLFGIFRKVCPPPSEKSHLNTPIDILEAFCEFASSTLHGPSTRFSQTLNHAANELHA